MVFHARRIAAERMAIWRFRQEYKFALLEERTAVRVRIRGATAQCNSAIRGKGEAGFSKTGQELKSSDRKVEILVRNMFANNQNTVLAFCSPDMHAGFASPAGHCACSQNHIFQGNVPH